MMNGLYITILVLFAVYMFTPRFFAFSCVAAYEAQFFLHDRSVFSGDALTTFDQIASAFLCLVFLYLAITEYEKFRTKLRIARNKR